MNAPKDYFEEDHTDEERLAIESCVESVEHLRRSFILGGAFVACFLIICFCSTKSHGAEIPEATAVHCILGEARGEGPQGIRLMASALRNRGKTQGVYGCRADLSKEMAYLKAKGIYQQAVKAWRDSAKTDLVKGATYWGSRHVDGAWIAKMKKHGYTLTIVHNGHEFYRKDS